ncbi:MAG TPA: hypothetical protein ENK08_06705 [Chloroflexi bacterium]|nr:hypothetical protein [Chloroflexota bacterium]
MKENRKWFLFGISILILLVAFSCIGGDASEREGEPTVASSTDSEEGVKGAVTPTITQVVPTSTSTPVPNSARTSPRAVIEAYYDALMEGHFEEAAGYFTPFSLKWSGVEREEIALRWERLVFEEEWQLIDYEVVDVSEGEDLAVARAWAKEGWIEGGEQQQETYDNISILARQADGLWGINYNQVLDVYVCDLPSQDHGGLKIRPLYLLRTWTDTFVGFEAENTTDRIAQWGWAAPEVATVTTVAEDGEKVYSFNDPGFQVMAHRRYPSLYFQLGMPFEGKPVKLVMKEWLWLDESGVPSWDNEHWTYEFDLSTGCTRQTAADWSE